MPALCLVATPLAAARAARRLCDAQGGVLFGPSVATLDRLVPGLLAAAGDRRALLSPLAARLLAAESGEAAGGPFAGLDPAGGLAAALARAIAELRAGEVTAAAARDAAATLEGAPAARLGALAAALEAYEARLADLGALDAPAALRAAAEAARRGAVSAETDGLELLVLDGVVALAPAGWELVAALAARARRTRVHLPFFPERPDVSAPAEPLLRRLEALHEVAVRREVEVVLARLEGDGRAPRISALLLALAGGPGPAASPEPGAGAPDGLVLAAAGAGEEGEADAAAGLLARLLEQGFGPEEIALVSPAPRRAAPALARACASLGLPFAAGRGAPLAEARPVRAALEALGAAGRLDRAAAERLLGSGWLAPARGAERLGALLDRAGALDGRAPPAEALRARAAALAGAPAERAALGRAADDVAALDAVLAPLAAPGTAREQAARLAALVDRAGLRRRAARGPRDVAARDLAALARLGDAAEEVARAAALVGRGAERLSPGRFRALLALAVDEASLPPGAEPAAGAVELSGLDEAPGLAARAVVVTGCVRGGFPPAPAPEPLLRDPERLAVNRALRRPAVAVAAARRAEALHRAFSAAAAGREAVAFSWAAPGPAGGGGPLAPLVAEALAAAGVAPPAGPAAEPGLAGARTARAALRAAVRAGEAGVAALGPGPLAARAADALARGGIEAGRRAAVLDGRAAPFAGAIEGPALAALRAALPEEWTPSQLELFARCPFRAFLQLAVHLPDPAPGDLEIDPRDEGSLLHAVLEAFVAARAGRRAWPPAGDAADLEEARAAAAGVLARFEREGRTGDPAAWAGRREVVLARLDRIVRAEARDHGGLVPALLEFRFGGGAPAPALALTAGGETVLVKGRVDRVDAGPDRLLVLDYKNARSGAPYAAQLEPEALGVTSFQIPAYLLAAARALPGRPRLEATYAVLKKAERLEPLVLAADDPRLAASPPADEAGAPPSFAAAVVEVVRRIRAGELPIASRGCGGCPHGAVCRFEGAAEREEAAA